MLGASCYWAVTQNIQRTQSHQVPAHADACKLARGRSRIASRSPVPHHGWRSMRPRIQRAYPCEIKDICVRESHVCLVVPLHLRRALQPPYRDVSTNFRRNLAPRYHLLSTDSAPPYRDVSTDLRRTLVPAYCCTSPATPYRSISTVLGKTLV